MGRHFSAAIAPRVLVLAILGLTWGGCGDSEGETKPELRLEVAAGAITIYVDDPNGDAAELAAGPNGVRFACVDSEGEVLVERKLGWPFTDTDAGTDLPHGHTPSIGAAIGKISNCRLTGIEGGPLEGSPSIPR